MHRPSWAFSPRFFSNARAGRNLLAAVLAGLFAVMAAVQTAPAAFARDASPVAGQDSPLVWPLPPAEPRVKFVRSVSGEADLAGGAKTFWAKLWAAVIGQGGAGAKFTTPYAFAELDGKILIADSDGATVWVLDLEGGSFRRFLAAAVNALLAKPVGIATDGRSRVYVADAARAKVFVFSAAGKLVGELAPSTPFGRPTGVAADFPGREVFVADTGAHQIVAFSADSLREVRRFGRRGAGPGEFNFPVQLAVGGGRLFVNDSLNFRIQILTLDGKPVASFGQAGDGSGDLGRPKGMAIDRDGNLLVADALFDVVQVFDGQGRLLVAFGGRGNGNGQFWLPTGVFVDSRNRIYVADSGNRRVQVFAYLERGNGR